MDEDSCASLVRRLTVGFGALLEQADQLHRRNAELELLLSRVRNEVCSLFKLLEHSVRYDESV